MSQLLLTDALFNKLAGWEAVKQGRSMIAAGRVIHSEWQPPVLRGTVSQDGSGTLRAGLVIHSDSDAENLCPCRDSRQRGIICAHSVAIGLHFVKSQSTPAVPSVPSQGISSKVEQKPALTRKTRTLQRATEEEEAEPLEISIILPPNLAEAISRNKVMVYLEGTWAKGRGPLNALPTTPPFRLSAQDNALLSSLEGVNEGDTPGMLVLTTAQFAQQLPAWTSHPRVTLGKSTTVEIRSEPARMHIRATLEVNGEILLKMVPSQGIVGKPGVLILGTTPWILIGDRLQPLGLPEGLTDLLNSSLRIPRARVPNFLSLDWPKLTENCEVEASFSLDDFSLDLAVPAFKLHLTGGLATLQAKLEVFYQGKPLTALSNEGPWLADPEITTRYLTRNFEAEQNAISRLRNQRFQGPDPQGLYHLKGQELVLNFFAREFGRVSREWTVTLEERLERSTHQNLERIEPSFRITSSGEQWFDLHIGYQSSGGDSFSPADIQRLLRSGQSHTRFKNGKFALLDTGAVEELQEVLLDSAPEQISQGYRLQSKQAAFLDATLSRQPNWTIQAPPAWKQQAAQQRGEVKLQVPPLFALDSILRPYQKQGVAWLNFLRENRFGGVLADEMGLGKTLQILALLNSLKLQSSPALAPCLVVCPTSLVFNWAQESAKFTPALRVQLLHGAERHKYFPQIPEYDLVVTSYALLRRDAELYKQFEFDSIVLDEAQHIKNRQTQNAQAVKAVRARHHLVLTGTPMENSVLDLWSIFDFLMPGYLGSARDFHERYELPITREKSQVAQERLARRLRPFLLRRLKREVAADLPQRIEQISFCELNAEQSRLYRQILETSRQEIVQAVEANGLAKSRMMVLTALLRLRQICCDLRLLPLKSGANSSQANSLPNPDHEKQESPSSETIASTAAQQSSVSGKLEMFNELLEEVLDGGHRVLVFSQFTTMLGLLAGELRKQSIDFCYLDGATRNRQEVVERFQRDSNIPVFLISLKAGGVGLNLTGADTVFHFDPWWNPAVEAQATDRAHRIGQKKIVTSYKLITRGTVEEKILNLQARKRALQSAMLGGEEQAAETLDWQEIQELLAV